jgi:hypothetical protein
MPEVVEQQAAQPETKEAPPAKAEAPKTPTAGDRLKEMASQYRATRAARTGERTRLSALEQEIKQAQSYRETADAPTPGVTPVMMGAPPGPPGPGAPPPGPPPQG